MPNRLLFDSDRFDRGSIRNGNAIGMNARALIAVLAALLAPAAATSAPPPPPPAEEIQALRSFFNALPRRLPTEDLETFASFVSPDVKVYEAGELKYGDRDAWFASLRAFGRRSSDPTGIAPVGLSISRESYYRTSGGGFMVLEFNYPIAPEGKQVVYHPTNPHRMVTYYLDDAGRLTRVDYGPTMSRYDWLLGKKTKPK